MTGGLFQDLSEGSAGRWGFLTACVEEKGLKHASVRKDGVHVYEGDEDDRKTRFGQGSECRSLLLEHLRYP